MTSRVARLARGVLVAPLIMLGCGKSGPTGPAGFPSDLVGTWVFQSATLGGATADLADILDWNPETVRARFRVEANADFVYEELDALDAQSWWESGYLVVDATTIERHVDMNEDGPDTYVATQTYTLTPSTLVVSSGAGGSAVVLTLTK